MAKNEGTSALLLFLTRDAKIPPLTSIERMKEMQKAGLTRWLTSSDDIAKSTLGEVQTIFQDPKQAKQVLNAAKRISKKRTSSEAESNSPSRKKQKQPASEEPVDPSEIEKSLVLPNSSASEEELEKIVLFTNRAPLVLAFAVSLLKHTMPSQPLSSRLSLAQAVVSVNSKSKAISLGMETGKSAEEEGWGEGQPLFKVMGREIRVMRRPGYIWKESSEDKAADEGELSGNNDTQEDTEPALWALDLESWKKSNGKGGQMPIYTAESARSYLLRSFDTPPSSSEEKAESKKKRSGAQVAAAKEHNLSLLLSALDMLYASWVSHLDTAELDRRAWGWYVRVRPEVESGPAGWGGKGEVKLSEILALRR
ncbi:hypothetical protein EV356DRAFT_523166 [Viridothelium virens]|uniref:Impact N-terminal domain-containing protein n=1 Tax=Viridothelium virens TaxID=1048519 RepID=A0A6A6HBB7_VIRVR|nr:hypothetical protein EV356DRAFT_523166 [Viridothelium virens]